MIPNLSELCMDAVFAPGDCGGDLKLPGREQGSLQSLMDQIHRFAASVCYTTNIADLLLTDMLNPANQQIGSCIINKLCEGKHSYELGWVDSSYRLTRTGEDMWTVSVIARSRKYQTRRHAWLMCDKVEDPSQRYEQDNVNTSQADVMRKMRLSQPVFFNKGLSSWNEFEANESVLDLKYTGDPELTELTLSVENLKHLSGEGENTLDRKRAHVDTGGGVEELKTAYLTKLRIYVPLKAWFTSHCESFWHPGYAPNVYSLAVWQVWLVLPAIKAGVARALELALLVPDRELVLALAKDTKCGEGRGSLLS